MATFKYTAIDQTGTEKSGTVEAGSKDEASEQIAGMGLMPTEVKKTKDKKKAQAKAGAPKKSLFGPGKVGQESITGFTRQISTLLQAQLPLLRCLQLMQKQEKNPALKVIIEDLVDNVQTGNNLSEGLAMHPKAFDRLFVNMTKAGEAGGILEQVLTSLANFMEKSLRTKKKVKSAMVYPVVVMGVAVLIVVMLMIVVVPKFQGIFEDMLKGQPLPGPTQIVVSLSEFIQHQFLLIVIGGFVMWIGSKLIKKTAFGVKASDWLSINVPKVGDMVRVGAISRFARTFGTLLSSGVPILQALTITGDTMGNQFFAKAISNVHDSVRDGEPLAVQMERETIFPLMVASMIEIGEETGQLPEMLGRVADTYDEELDNAVGAMTSIIEPIMIVFLAVVVGFIVIALFLPIVAIIEGLSS